jgi:tetratricopeptide (TPR) repeat protein
MIFLGLDGRILDTDEPDRWMEEAKRLMADGQTDEAMLQAVKAIAWCRDAKEQALDDEGVLIGQIFEGRTLAGIGILHNQQSRWNEAITNFKQAIGAFDSALALASEDDDASLLGHDRSALGAHAADCKMFAGVNLANAYAMSGNFEKAAAVAQNCCKMPCGALRAQALHVAGMANAELGRFKIAVEQLEEARTDAARRGDQKLLDDICATLERLSVHCDA